MKSQLTVVGIVAVFIVNLFSISVDTNLVNAKVICVDKYNYASVIPCSDQNAIAAPAGVNMTAEGNMTVAVNSTEATNSTATAVMPQQQSNFVANLSGQDIVPPVNSTATGTAKFSVNPNGILSYEVDAMNINQVIGVPVGLKNGTELVELLNLYASTGEGNRQQSTYPTGPVNGQLVSGVITAAKLDGPLFGKNVTDLINLIKSGSAYVTLRTTPHQHGEIRGQILPSLIAPPTAPGMNKTAGINAATTAAGLNATTTSGMNTATIGCTPGYNRTCNVPLNATRPSTSSTNPPPLNPVELNQIRNATLSKCEQTNTMKYCAQQELQLYGNTLEPGVRSLVQCETQHSMDYCFSNAGPVTGNNVLTSSTHRIPIHPSGHTAAYNQGFSDGTTSARNSGINDPGSACDSHGYKGRDCNHYLQGYADGFNSNCSRSKFGCDGQGNPKLAP